MTNTFNLTFNTDGDRGRSLQVRDAKTDLSVDDFLIHVNNIIDSGLFNNADMTVTGIKRGELVTQTKVRYA